MEGVFGEEFVCLYVCVACEVCLYPQPTAMLERDTPGYAIGGLSGGEEKDVFWRIVSLCTDMLPRNKPRYLMGVGWGCCVCVCVCVCVYVGGASCRCVCVCRYPVDLVVCSALGCDMYDCVYPTRTAVRSPLSIVTNCASLAL